MGGSNFTRVIAGMATGGLSEVVGAAMGGFDAGATPSNQPAPPEIPDEKKQADTEAAAERRRRQLIARQNNLIRTSPTGAAINQTLLGSQPTLSGT